MASATGVRLTMKVNSAQLLRNTGWIEAIDLGYADLPTAIASQAGILALIRHRADCLGTGGLLVSAVLSAYVQPVTPGAPPIRRSTIALPVPVAPAAGQAYNKAFLAEKGFTADFSTTVYYVKLQTNLSGSPVYARNYWLAGLPDIADQTDSTQIIDPATLTAVQTYLKDLDNSNPTLSGKNSVSIRSIDRAIGNPVKQCTAWNLLANTYTVPAHGFVASQPVLAEGCKTVPGGSCPRGRYLIGTVLDANTITLQGSAAPTAPIKLGGFRAAVYTFNTVSSAVGQGFTKRDHGRPSGLQVGRRRTPSIKRA